MLTICQVKDLVINKLYIQWSNKIQEGITLENMQDLDKHYAQINKWLGIWILILICYISQGKVGEPPKIW